MQKSKDMMADGCILHELLPLTNGCFTCNVALLFVILVISRFGFEDWIWGLTALVPGLCIPSVL